MRFEPDKVREKARSAATEDLLDRVTAFRDALEPEAVPILEAELARRGVSRAVIAAHAEGLRERVVMHRGIPTRCRVCPRAATSEVRVWHRLWGLVPLFRVRAYFCDEHAPGKA
jgi:hypothetical protein